MEKPKIKYIMPPTDKEKEICQGVKIEYLTMDQMIEKYGNFLTEAEITELRNLANAKTT